MLHQPVYLKISKFLEVFNHGKNIFEIKKNDRIAQMIVCPIIKVELKEVESLPETVRGEGGFGSTNK